MPVAAARNEPGRRDTPRERKEAWPVSKEPRIETDTSAGRVLGRVETMGGREAPGRTAVAVFRGIPFARPPFGALRFAAPEPPEPWGGVREMAAYGPRPPQYDRMGPAEASGDTDPAPDCLTLNVWSPDLGGSGLPVMVWVQGGAYVFGHAGDPVYDGARLASEGVVVVTFNYRVGMEGFGRLAGAPDNRGLLDQLAALRWVQDNIAAFGGDPSRVTVFGESAGAGSTAALLASEESAGLLHRAVAQSVPGSYFTPELAGDVALAVAARLGLPATSDALRATDSAALVGAAEEVFAARAGRADRWGAVAASETVLSPVVDGAVLPCTPWEALERGAACGIDLLLGYNRDEYRLFMAKRGEFGGVDEERATWALGVFGAAVGGERAYRAAHPGLSAEALYETVCSDWLCRVPTVQLLEAQAAVSGRAYAYELRWPAPVFNGRLGACHGLDVPLVFGNLDAPLARQMLGSELPPEAVELSRRMRTAWARFAATGDPGWPSYETDGRLTKVYDRSDTVVSDPLGPSRRLWRGSRFRALGMMATDT